ncbi:MAG: hypothetical protein D8M58_15145 [Calditrichaeota bacterium]|nr:MAG: hypothetical protein DWQ03_16385 [Calditrichota bacterium]MBL1206740.1 hypothetical protein [Calditrichota bacterium]NOG46566.1 BamA/TamA family outer membrane protein [Calditrichota bacterium]
MLKFFKIHIFVFFFSNFLYSQSANPIIISLIEFGESFQKLNISELENVSGLSNNSRFNPSMVNQYADKITRYLNQQGYLYARIDKIAYTFSSDSASVKVNVIGMPGKIVLVGKIEVASDSLSSILYQNLFTVREFDPYSELSIENDLTQMLSYAADSGFVFAKVRVTDMDIRKEENDFFADINIHISEGKRIFIDRVELNGNDYTKENVILRELPTGVGRQYSKSTIEQIPQQLMRLGIFKNVKTPAMLIGKNGEYILSLEIEEGNATTFDGVVGFIPENKTSSKTKSGGFFTGLVDISFRNLFGTARSFDVHWEKPDRDSENFFLRYTEPWLLGYPFDISGSLERTVRDSTYIEWKGGVQTRWRYNRNFSIVSSLQRQVVLPDSFANVNLRLVRYEQMNLEVGLVYDTRDYAINPRKGIYLGNSYTFGLKNNFGPGFLLREDNIKTNEQIELLKLNFKWFYELFHNQVLAIQLTGNQVKGNRLQLTDFVWFGGAKTLRGYRENQFRGDLTAWMNLEYRFLLGRNSRIFLFNDWGAYHFKDSQTEIEEILPGYGIGLRLNTGLGIMAVDFGLGKGDDFSQAKIHFGLINRF